MRSEWGKGYGCGDGGEGAELEEFGKGALVVLSEFGVFIRQFFLLLVFLEFDGGGFEDFEDEGFGSFLEEDVVEAE